MRITFTIWVIFFCFTQTTIGAWLEVARNTAHSRYFIDLSKLETIQPNTYAWSLVNFLEPQKSGDMSEISYLKVSCEEFRYRVLKILRYGGPMGMGNVTNDFVPDYYEEWIAPRTGTAKEVLIQKICENSAVGF